MDQHTARRFPDLFSWWLGDVPVANPSVSNVAHYIPEWLCHCSGTNLLHHRALSDEIELTGKISDYWIVRRARLHIPMLYQNEGIYRYIAGVVSL